MVALPSKTSVILQMSANVHPVAHEYTTSIICGLKESMYSSTSISIFASSEIFAIRRADSYEKRI